MTERDERMHRLKDSSKVVGLKQTLRALEKGTATLVYVADDAQRHVVQKVVDSAGRHGVPVVHAKTMVELAEACNVEVKTATAALIANN